ncbi:PQ loop repeat-containing protein 2 [Dimargaris verticillata]|uniref:PQ loop repeat-containing protein 2 n=1 Tax=Dimargaris verticillata TaxID=2761393 RepID=A0A9W8BC99_9FUNG|nr:PQ loop repeat-containing protein 2 [Dimargaris verticillata]
MTTCTATALLAWVPLAAGTCTVDWVALAAQLCSTVSIACWVCALSPQIYLNWRNSSADSLSPGFIAIWLSGDVCNLVGCLLTNQLFFQKFLGVYFCSFDAVLLLQIFYYSWWRPWSQQRRWSAGHASLLAATPDPSSPLLPTSCLASADTTYTSLSAYDPGLVGQGPRSRRAPFLKACAVGGSVALLAGSLAWWGWWQGLGRPVLASLGEQSPPLVGRIIAWTCTALYITSRLPQIWKNYRRRSVEGLSFYMFLFALNGNLFYFCSIFLQASISPPGLLWASLPYILGSAGTVVQDMAIFVQWHHYSTPSTTPIVVPTTAAINGSWEAMTHPPTAPGATGYSALGVSIPAGTVKGLQPTKSAVGTNDVWATAWPSSGQSDVTVLPVTPSTSAGQAMGPDLDSQSVFTASVSEEGLASGSFKP